MIQISHLSKFYVNQTIFENVSLTIHKGEKIGLIGRNGHGKSTLLRIIYGSESADSGEILFPKHYKISQLSQELNFMKNTVLDEVISCLQGDIEEEQWKAKKVLFGLDFSEEKIASHPKNLSGGWMNRINLAKVLISDANLLLLDEPTNHLDITTIEWLTKFLKGWKKELILVSHDQEFMDSIIDHTIAIHRYSMKKLPGNSQKMYEQIAQEEINYEKTRIKDEKERVHIEKFIRRFKAKASLASMAQSRVKSLEKRQKLQKLDKSTKLDFEFSFRRFSTQTMINLKNISFGYSPENLLIKDLEFQINKGDRFAFIGKNGKGKSTLLKILQRILSPTSGEIKYHPELVQTYYGQISEHELDPNLSVEEEIAQSLPADQKHFARNIAGSIMFSGDLAFKKCSVLSGGEKARVVLGKIIAQPTHCLLLDEPSNHLDIESTRSLIEALDQFKGAVILVTHNKTILQTLANKLIVFDSEAPYLYQGTYQEFLDNIGFSKPNIEEMPSKPKKEKKMRISPNSKEKNIAHLEKEIKNYEEQIQALEFALSESSIITDHQEIRKLSEQLQQISEKMDATYSLLEENLEDF